MVQQAAHKTYFTASKIQQAVKWTVYTLLIMNFVFYLLEDLNRAAHTLHSGSTFLDWTSEFATSIDESAWFLLLFMFELETYAIKDKDWTGWVAHAVHGVRLFCYLLLAHTVYAYLIVVMSLQPNVAIENVSNLCNIANSRVSYVYNLEYTVINGETCGGLSSESQFYWLTEGSTITDLPGLNLERNLAWVDLIEVITWIFILLAIEIVVRLQGRSVSGGAILSTANTLKILLYVLLIALSLYWASLSHWFYVWDELVWIGGFAAIEMNINDWRNDMIDEQEAT